MLRAAEAVLPQPYPIDVGIQPIPQLESAPDILVTSHAADAMLPADPKKNRCKHPVPVDVVVGIGMGKFYPSGNEPFHLCRQFFVDVLLILRGKAAEVVRAGLEIIGKPPI